jgi:hypothetical protein
MNASYRAFLDPATWSTSPERKHEGPYLQLANHTSFESWPTGERHVAALPFFNLGQVTFLNG